MQHLAMTAINRFVANEQNNATQTAHTQSLQNSDEINARFGVAVYSLVRVIPVVPKTRHCLQKNSLGRRETLPAR